MHVKPVPVLATLLLLGGCSAEAAGSFGLTGGSSDDTAAAEAWWLGACEPVEHGFSGSAAWYVETDGEAVVRVDDAGTVLDRLTVPAGLFQGGGHAMQDIFVDADGTVHLYMTLRGGGTVPALVSLHPDEGLVEVHYIRDLEDATGSRQEQADMDRVAACADGRVFLGTAHQEYTTGESDGSNRLWVLDRHTGGLAVVHDGLAPTALFVDAEGDLLGRAHVTVMDAEWAHLETFHLDLETGAVSAHTALASLLDDRTCRGLGDAWVSPLGGAVTAYDSSLTQLWSLPLVETVHPGCSVDAEGRLVVASLNKGDPAVIFSEPPYEEGTLVSAPKLHGNIAFAP